eukprot:COSAG02_NODE_1453_length_12551_cov_2.557420_10_plen_114_part_00
MPAAVPSVSLRNPVSSAVDQVPRHAGQRLPVPVAQCTVQYNTTVYCRGFKLRGAIGFGIADGEITSRSRDTPAALRTPDTRSEAIRAYRIHYGLEPSDFSPDLRCKVEFTSWT